MKGSIHQTKYGWQVRFDKITRRFKQHEHTEHPHRGFTPAERFLNGLQYETDRGTFDIRDYQKDQPLAFEKLKEKFIISKRKKRISPRTLQDIFRTAADQLGIDKKLHARLFRHTAATHLNKVAGIEITQHVLGHSRRANTLIYTHLNPDQYAAYMKKHPFMRKEPR